MENKPGVSKSLTQAPFAGQGIRSFGGGLAFSKGVARHLYCVLLWFDYCQKLVS